MLQKPVIIRSFASISALGHDQSEVWQSYLDPKSFITKKDVLSSDLSQQSVEQIEAISGENNKYRSVDKTVLYALFVSRLAYRQSQWDKSHQIGINMGSSRGATALFEKYHNGFITGQKVETLASPTTTLGNISSWLAHDLQIDGPTISHSITCSTALHAFLNGIAWLNAGMADRFIVGGSEAANTSFTVAQMQALKIYSNEAGDFPCRSLDFKKKKNTMVLGEGAAVFCIEKDNGGEGVAKITGYGYATEPVHHNASISTNADCFQKSMKMALNGMNSDEIDGIVMHAPGTIKGDQSELNAIKAVFGNQHPALTSNKWKIGHALGSSGAFNIEMAVLMLKNQKLIESPFYKNANPPQKLKNILVNAVGFGGNAVSLVVSI